MKCGLICARNASTSARSRRERDASSSASSIWLDAYRATSPTAPSIPGPGARVVTTASTPITPEPSASSGWAITAGCRPDITRRWPDTESRAARSHAATTSADQILSSGGSRTNNRPSPSNTTTPSAPVSSRKCGAAASADSGPSPLRSARAARDAVCSASCTARSVGVATTRRVRTRRPRRPTRPRRAPREEPSTLRRTFHLAERPLGRPHAPVGAGIAPLADQCDARPFAAEFVITLTRHEPDLY